MKTAMLCVLSMMAAACTGLADAQPASVSTDDTTMAATADDALAASTPTGSAPTSRPAAVGSTFAGFSYHTNGVRKELGWARAVVDVMDYNTFTSASYDIFTGTFTAPIAGFYRFSTYGYSQTVTPRPDTRIGLGFTLNGGGDHMVAVAGGQFSTVDTPMPFLSHVLRLAAGDKISLFVYSDFAFILGAPSSPTGLGAFYFQGEYLGQ